MSPFPTRVVRLARRRRVSDLRAIAGRWMVRSHAAQGKVSGALRAAAQDLVSALVEMMDAAREPLCAHCSASFRLPDDVLCGQCRYDADDPEGAGAPAWTRSHGGSAQ
jgi:hypothetical protein